MDDDCPTGSTDENDAEVVVSSEHIIHCDVCLEDREKTPAAGFCEDCQDYLCSDCKRCHHKNRLSRSHSILDSNEMPLQKKMRVKPSPFEIFESCQQHEKELSFICLNEDVLCCEICKITYHRKCDKIYQIANVLDEEGDAEVIHEMANKLETIYQQFACHDRNCKINRDIAGCMYSKAVCMMTSMLSALKHNDLLKIYSVSRTCETALSDISSLKDYMDSVLATSNVSRNFIAMKIIEKQMKRLGESIEAVNEEGKMSMYEFVPNKVKTGSFADRQSINIGQLVLHAGAVPYYDICVKSPSDKNDCVISGMCLLSQGLLCVIDKMNSKVKVVDTKTGILTFELQLLQSPDSVARLNGNRLAVTQTGGKIQLMTALPHLSTIRTDSVIQTNGDCKGIAFLSISNTIAVSSCNPRKIQIMDLAGRLVETLQHDMFTQPNSMIQMNDKLYVADHASGKVLCLDLDGNVEASFKFEKSNVPKCIVQGSDGSILVSFSGNQSILQIDQELEHGKSVLEVRDLPEVLSIGYDISDRILFIGTAGNRLKRYFL